MKEKTLLWVPLYIPKTLGLHCFKYLFAVSKFPLQAPNLSERIGYYRVITLRMSHQTVIYQLKMLVFTKKLDMGGTPINPKKKQLCIDACESLLNRNKIDLFLKRMETEMWVLINGSQLWARKVCCVFWWDWQGIIYYMLLPYGQGSHNNWTA